MTRAGGPWRVTGEIATLCALYWSLAFAGTVAAVLATKPMWAPQPRLVPLDEFLVDTAMPYFGEHAVGILVLAAAAGIIVAVHPTTGWKVLCIAFVAVLVEVGTQREYLGDWLRDVRIYLVHGQTKFHVFSVVPELAVWIGVPLTAAVLSGIIVSRLWTPTDGVRGGRTSGCT